jgi:hypothetical protein
MHKFHYLLLVCLFSFDFVCGSLDVFDFVWAEHLAWPTIKKACGNYYREAGQEFPKHATYALKDGQLGRHMQYELQ